MKPRKLFPRLMAHVGVALLLLNSATAPLAQRRRRSPPPPSHARTRVTAPTLPNATAPAHTTTTQMPPASAQPTQQPQQPQQPQPTPTPTPTPTQHRREPDLALEEMLAADSYSVYAEVRNVGTLARAEELKTAVGALALFGDETKPLTDLFAFVSDNAETLAAARIVVTFLPARSGLPQTLVAVELASSEEAIAFEPKFRRLVGEQVRAVKQAIDPQPLKQAESNTSDTSDPHRTPTKQLAELKAQTKAETKTETRTENKAETKAEMRTEAKPENKAEPKTSAPGFALRRAGRWLIVAESPFTLKRLRGEEGEARFADSPRFQAVRGRFGSSALFVYVDTNVAQQGWALQQQKDTEAEANATLTATTTDNPSGVPVTIEQGPPQPVIMPPVVTPTATTLPQSTAASTPAASATPTQTDPEALEQSGEDDKEAVSEAERSKPSEVEENLSKLPPPPKPTEEQLAVSGMGGLLRNLWGGIPRIPGAVALGVGLERGAVALRLAVENTPDGTIAIIPFLPNIVSGPPVTADAASVAPADSELFFAASLDWTQIYNSTLGAATVNPALLGSLTGEGVEEVKGERPPTAEQTIAAAEKLFGFKFKEDLLPALGNEVAFSMPFGASEFGFGLRPPDEEKEGKEEKDAEPGPVYIASLNDPDKVREILPRVLVLLGLASLGDPTPAAERREGFEIRGAGSLTYTFINNFLILGELKAVRHVVDAYSARQTLAAANIYRDSTSWQQRQKLVHLFFSGAPMRDLMDAVKKRSGGSTDPSVRALLTRLETVEPEPVSYEATNEGDVIVHELRLPLSFLSAYAISTAIGIKDMHVITGEASALFALSHIGEAESAFKEEKMKGRYGTLEELVAEELLEKDFVEHLEYKFELSAVGDKFEAVATPKSYGKTGRRSFFADETGKVRAADHKGQPATADDPPVSER